VQFAKLGVAVVAVGLSALVAFSVVSLHLGVRAVLTGSMRPDYGPGAVLLTERIPVSTIRPGMIILFVPPGESSEFAHRVTSVTGSKDEPVITTKGDANKAPDPWHAKLVTPYANKVIGSLPGIGRVIVAIRGTGQIILAVLGGLIAAWAGSKWILGSPRPTGRRTTAGTT
jgi:signal peptidase I